MTVTGRSPRARRSVAASGQREPGFNRKRLWFFAFEKVRQSSAIKDRLGGVEMRALRVIERPPACIGKFRTPGWFCSNSSSVRARLFVRPVWPPGAGYSRSHVNAWSPPVGPSGPARRRRLDPLWSCTHVSGLGCGIPELRSFHNSTTVEIRNFETGRFVIEDCREPIVRVDSLPAIG
jgi:hypothetical protein